MKRLRAFSMVELLMVMAIIALLVGLLLPALGAARRNAQQMKAAAQVRGLHAGAVIFSQGNNTYLPGLDRDGHPVLDGTDTGYSGSGNETAAGRWWILLNGIYVPPSMLCSPGDSAKPWETGALSTSQFSYALLHIASASTESGRIAEWRDHANSKSVIMTDRNISQDNPGGNDDANVQSIWTVQTGVWNGIINWGDNHTEFVKTHVGLDTRYVSNVTTNDNIFADFSSGTVTDNTTDPSSNALMWWN